MKPIPDEADYAGTPRTTSSSALTIDLDERKVTFRYLSPRPQQGRSAHGVTKEGPGRSHDLSFSLAGKPEHALESFLSMSGDLPPLDQTVVTIGHLADPLLPFSQFKSVLYVVEELLAHRVQALCIRTRSPLIILLMPLLRGASDRISICISLETPYDDVARHFTPDLPRPSERLHTARSLAALGVCTTLDVAPIVGSHGTRAKLRRFAQILNETGCNLRLRSLGELLPQGHPLLRQIPMDADKLLEQELTALQRTKLSGASDVRRARFDFGEMKAAS